MNLKELWNDLPGIAKVIIICIVAYLAYVAFKSLKAGKEVIDSQIDNKAEFTVLNQQGVKPSYTGAQYGLIADSLEAAMTVANNLTLLYTAIGKIRNDMDFIRVEQAFGSRSSSISESLFLGIATEATLRDWIKELGPSEVSKINEHLSKSGNVTKRF